MERRFDMSDFEQSLKDHADQFSLTPSKRVWNGIYNNLHPGSKWPSVTIAIVFIITLFIVGNLNNSKKDADNSSKTTRNENSKPTNNTNNISDHTIKTNQDQLSNSPEIKIINDQILTDKNTSTSNSTSRNISSEKVNSSILSLNDATKNSNQIAVTNHNSEKNIFNKHRNKEKPLNTTAGNNISVNEAVRVTPDIYKLMELQTIDKFLIPNESIYAHLSDLVIPVSNESLYYSPPFFFGLEKTLNLQSENPTSLNSSPETKPAQKNILRKKNKKVEWIFYATPSISTVYFDKTSDLHLTSQTPSSGLQNQSRSSLQLIRNTNFGLETGAEMTYKISKKFKFVTGANINYSAYDNVSNLIHPTFGTLILRNKSGVYAKSYLTHYGDGQSPSQISLTNYNLDISIPVGLQYTIWENGKIQIELASTIEPSAILKSDAYIISSDGRYYLNDPSMVRKFNMGANFGSYITFTTKKIKWHLGPDFRYQLLSTYKNIYSSKEHFMDYGIRIGISKP
ncbi:MAG: hypothetical protein ABI372_04780 [Ginsengibacter sp.]